MTWESLYAARQVVKYPLESDFFDYKESDKLLFFDFLFAQRPHSLDPPLDITNVELRFLLKEGTISRSPKSSRNPSVHSGVFLLDDRRHHLQRAAAGRLDSTEKHDGLIGIHKAVNPQEFFDYARSKKVGISSSPWWCRQLLTPELKRYEKDSNAEKRTV